MATLKTGTTIAGQTAWHANNDGAGSGLDADTLDGLHATSLGLAQVATTSPSVRGAGDLWTGYTPTSTFDTAWIYPTLGNSWVKYGDASWPSPRYRKTVDGLLMMDGMITGGANASSPFTLPVGYRPEYQQLMATENWDQVVARINIYATGVVTCEWVTGAATWYSLHVTIWVG